MILAACLENPCPRGSTRGSRAACRTLEVDSSTIEGPDETDEIDDDAAAPGAAMDSDVEAPDTLAGKDDAGDPDREEDTGLPTEADADTPVECADDARDSWRGFQMSADLVSAIASCYQANPGCSTSDCDLASCLKSSAQVSGCDRCVAAEVSCATEHCLVPCGVPTDDDACRACACANHCLDAPAGCDTGSVDACGDCIGAGCSARSSALTDTITIPIFFHLLHDRVDPATGIPAHALNGGEQETILDIDARLVEANAALEAARPDGRTLRLVRAGVSYAPASGACPDPVAATDARRKFGALNVVLTADTPSCAAAATSAFAGRASGASLLRIVGNMLGIAPADQQGDPWQIAPAQLVRMHNYARWRLGAAEDVPPAEREASAGFPFAPPDPIWDKLTNRDSMLINASVFDATAAGPFSSRPATEHFRVRPTGATRLILGVRVSAKYKGVPTENLHVIVDPQRNPRGPIKSIPRSAMWVGQGTLIADEAFDGKSEVEWWSDLRRRYAGGLWTVSIDDTADLTISDIRLEIVLGDRTFGSYDRHARGVADLMVYRRATSELLTAMNPANGSRNFGAIVSDPVPPLPESDAAIMSGDVNGDGTVDLLAHRGSKIWVAFSKRGFAAWRPCSIAGTDQPTGADHLVLGDFDNDGFGDLLRRRADLQANESHWAYYRGVGDGTFDAARVPAPAPNMTRAPLPADIRFTVADWYHSGRSTLFLRPAREPYIVFTHNDTPPPTTSGVTPAFTDSWYTLLDGTVEAFPSSEQVVVLDANNDGNDDLVVRRPGTGEWSVCINNSIEQFSAMQPLTIGGQRRAFEDSDVILGAM